MAMNLTQIEGISIVVAEELLDEGIKTVEQLADSTPEQISKIIGVSVTISEEWIAKANEFLRNNEQPKVPPGEKLTSKYSMKTTTKRDIEENKE
ncbi:MAG: helix-hairpin-helix domain-containing protein [Promethearchaeota archaeon]|nr:MAG: helix-hairpin-helix domain-containing protein [Candidatus Lokiarchaeota archaeon]